MNKEFIKELAGATLFFCGIAVIGWLYLAIFDGGYMFPGGL